MDFTVHHYSRSKLTNWTLQFIKSQFVKSHSQESMGKKGLYSPLHRRTWLDARYKFKALNSSRPSSPLILRKLEAFNPPMIQNTADPAEARMKRGRLIKNTSPYCSTRLNSRPTNFNQELASVYSNLNNVVMWYCFHVLVKQKLYNIIGQL